MQIEETDQKSLKNEQNVKGNQNFKSKSKQANQKNKENFSKQWVRQNPDICQRLSQANFFTTKEENRYLNKNEFLRILNMYNIPNETINKLDLKTILKNI